MNQSWSSLPKKMTSNVSHHFPALRIGSDRWMTPKCLHYDISDVQATATQTDRPSEHSVVGTQTVIQKKLRKGRCHGRASQTDPIDISSTTWEQLPLPTIMTTPHIAEQDSFDADGSPDDFFMTDSVRVNQTTEAQSPAEPVIINDAFIAVLMSRMETMMTNQLHTNG